MFIDIGRCNTCNVIYIQLMRTNDLVSNQPEISKLLFFFCGDQYFEENKMKTCWHYKLMRTKSMATKLEHNDYKCFSGSF